MGLFDRNKIVIPDTVSHDKLLTAIVKRAGYERRNMYGYTVESFDGVGCPCDECKTARRQLHESLLNLRNRDKNEEMKRNCPNYFHVQSPVFEETAAKTAATNGISLAKLIEIKQNFIDGEVGTANEVEMRKQSYESANNLDAYRKSYEAMLMDLLNRDIDLPIIRPLLPNPFLVRRSGSVVPSPPPAEEKPCPKCEFKPCRLC